MPVPIPPYSETNMRCLIIEDEIGTSRYVRDGLSELGHTAVACHADSDRLHHALDHQWDVIIVDRMLGGSSDAPALVEQVPAFGNETSVIVLGRMRDTKGRATGPRRSGADYITEPFSFPELLARIGALAYEARTPTHSALLRVARSDTSPRRTND